MTRRSINLQRQDVRATGRQLEASSGLFGAPLKMGAMMDLRKEDGTRMDACSPNEICEAKDCYSNESWTGVSNGLQLLLAT